MKVHLHIKRERNMMIITFCGHSEFKYSKELEQQMLDILEKEVGDDPAEMYLGGYGDFDAFAYQCCKKYKELHPNIKLIFVTPYLTPEYQRNHLSELSKSYDLILYPELEDKIPRFAIVYRNRYMVDAADLVIALVAHSFGGAYKTLKYAQKKGKRILNIALIY